MNKHVTKYYILLLLTVMFAAPGITAYLFYQHPSWLGSSTVNKGRLLNPPIALPSLDKQPKWRLVFWSPQTCEEACLKQLDVIARIRLALGRKLYYVDQWLVLGADASPVSAKINALLKEQDFHVTQLFLSQVAPLKLLPNESGIFIANPDNYLILSYQSFVDPDDVYKDLKVLLNTTENKRG